MPAPSAPWYESVLVPLLSLLLCTARRISSLVCVEVPSSLAVALMQEGLNCLYSQLPGRPVLFLESYCRTLADLRAAPA